MKSIEFMQQAYQHLSGELRESRDASTAKKGAETESSIQGTKRRIGLVPGGSRNALREDGLRRWPIEYYSTVAKALLGLGHEVVILGAETDRWTLSSFVGLNVESLIGQTPLQILPSVLRKLDAVITHDTGLLHLSNAVGLPMIAIFGPTNPSEFFEPLNSKSRLFWGGETLPCRPCYDGHNFAACRDNRCMRAIAPEIVITEIKNLIACI